MSSNKYLKKIKLIRKVIVTHPLLKGFHNTTKLCKEKTFSLNYTRNFCNGSYRVWMVCVYFSMPFLVLISQCFVSSFSWTWVCCLKKKKNLLFEGEGISAFNWIFPPYREGTRRRNIYIEFKQTFLLLFSLSVNLVVSRVFLRFKNISGNICCGIFI